MKVKIEIDTRTFVRFWLVVIGFLLVAFAIYSARVALIILGSAMFLAVALSPSVSRIAKILPRKSRTLSTAISYIIVVLALGLFGFLVVPPIVNQTVKFAETVPALVDSATKQYDGLNSFIEEYNLQPEFNNIVNSIKSSATTFTTDFGTKIINGIGSLFTAIASIILVLVLSFLMLIEAPTWLNRIWSIYQDEHLVERHRHILRRMYTVITGYVTGQISVATIAGSLSVVVVLILSIFFNVPANLAIPLAVIVFISSLIPIFGSTIGGALLALVLMLNDFTAAVIFMTFFILYQQVEANYISPKIQSKKIDLSPLIILASVTIGIYLLGIIGGIISIPIAGCLNIIISDYFADRKAKKNLEDGLTVEINDNQSKDLKKVKLSSKK